MDSDHNSLLLHQQTIVTRFVAACRADDRVIAAFLRGSHATGRADRFSDVDLSVITADDGFESFYVQRDEFIRQLGRPEFIEDFDIPHIVFIIFADGTEVEISFGSESNFRHLHEGAFRILVDKTQILGDAVFLSRGTGPDEQVENLRRLVYWFWHDLSHLITAIGRDQLWWAHGQLDELRRICIGLARLKNNFSDPDVLEDVYFKLESVVPPADLVMLESTFCPMDPSDILNAGFTLVRFFQETAVPLAKANGVDYPGNLETVFIRRMESLRG